MNKIKLVGIRGDHLYESWRTKVYKVLQDLQILSNLEEVNEVDEIISFNIRAIPALLINDAVLIEQDKGIPNIEEFKTSILGYIHNKDTY